MQTGYEAIRRDYLIHSTLFACFYMDLSRKITLEEYINAFYTTGLFKVERAILFLTVHKPSVYRKALLKATYKNLLPRKGRLSITK